MFLNRNHTQTLFVLLDTKKCKACWQCLGSCQNQAIGKVDLPWHKHALIVEPDSCTGCLNCINICQYGAYSVYDGAKYETEKLRSRTFTNFLINNLLIISGLIMIYSGLVLQVGFHMGGPDEHQIEQERIQSHSIQYEQLREIDLNKIVSGFNYPSWSAIHKFVIVFFSLLIIYHTYIHWKWYKVVFSKRLFSKHRLVIILSAVFLLVALTGLAPWFIDLSGSTSIWRMLFIEIHDKITFIFIFFLVLHFAKKAKWYATAYKKLKR
jgi:2-oxoglutarate ferredoxin oxidoreductase subunit delta